MWNNSNSSPDCPILNPHQLLAVLDERGEHHSSDLCSFPSIRRVKNVHLVLHLQTIIKYKNENSICMHHNTPLDSKHDSLK